LLRFTQHRLFEAFKMLASLLTREPTQTLKNQHTEPTVFLKSIRFDKKPRWLSLSKPVCAGFDRLNQRYPRLKKTLTLSQSNLSHTAKDRVY